MRIIAALIIAAMATFSSHEIGAAQTAPKQTISDISFLGGTWSSGNGVVAETGESSHGTSTFTTEVGGKALLRRDHVDLFGKDGKPTGSFEIVMLIYPEAGTIRADYTDGAHIIHYTSAAVVPGHSIAFSSLGTPGTVAYRLTYELTMPKTLGVRFEISPLGDGNYRPIATGSLTRA